MNAIDGKNDSVLLLALCERQLLRVRENPVSADRMGGAVRFIPLAADDESLASRMT